MILHFKHKQYNWGDSFYIYDDNNNRKYHVKSSVLLWNKKFEIRDLDKNVLVTIKSEPTSLLKKKFYILINNQQVAAITKEISLVPKFFIEGYSWEMKGVMALDYSIVQGNQEILSINEEVTDWGFRPVLRISEHVDPLVALGFALTISYVMTAEEGKSSTNYL